MSRHPDHPEAREKTFDVKIASDVQPVAPSVSADAPIRLVQLPNHHPGCPYDQIQATKDGLRNLAPTVAHQLAQKWSASTVTRHARWEMLGVRKGCMTARFWKANG
jgi:hypothetical protein